MKRIPFKMAFIIMMLSSLLVGCEKFPYEDEVLDNIKKPTIIDEYIYPIRPGNEAWSYLKTEEERFSAVQIPESILNSISTWGLISTCFNFPISGHWTAFKIPDFINSLPERFNGLNDLLSRDDARLKLLYSYRYLKVTDYNFIQLGFIEQIIGCDRFVNILDHKQQIYLVSVALSKYDEVCQFPDLNVGSSVFVMGNVMLSAGYQPFIDYCALKKDYGYGGFQEKFNSPADKIVEYAKKFVKD